MRFLCKWLYKKRLFQIQRAIIFPPATVRRISQSQLKRTSALVDSLSRGFNIAAEKIRYPADWQL
jgi:hypothetical protein